MLFVGSGIEDTLAQYHLLMLARESIIRRDTARTDLEQFQVVAEQADATIRDMEHARSRTIMCLKVEIVAQIYSRNPRV